MQEIRVLGADCPSKPIIPTRHSAKQMFYIIFFYIRVREVDFLDAEQDNEDLKRVWLNRNKFGSSLLAFQRAQPLKSNLGTFLQDGAESEGLILKNVTK